MCSCRISLNFSTHCSLTCFSPGIEKQFALRINSLHDKNATLNHSKSIEINALTEMFLSLTCYVTTFTGATPVHNFRITLPRHHDIVFHNHKNKTPSLLPHSLSTRYTHSNFSLHTSGIICNSHARPSLMV